MPPSLRKSELFDIKTARSIHIGDKDNRTGIPSAHICSRRELGSVPAAQSLRNGWKAASLWVARPRWVSCEGLPAPPPADAPSASPAAGSSKQSHNQQQQYCTDRRVDDRTDQSGTQMDTEPGQQPIADKGADDPDKEVAEDSEAGSTDDLTSQPSRNDADEQYDQQALVRQMHWSPRNLGQAQRLKSLHQVHRQRLRRTTVPQSR